MSKTNTKEIKGGVLLSYALIGLNSLVGIIYTPILLRFLGHSDFALYSLSANIIGFLIFLDFGLSNGIVRYISMYRFSDRINKQYSLYGLFLIVFLFISFLILGVGYIIYQNLFGFYGESMTLLELVKIKTIMVIMFITMAVSFPFNLFSSILIAYEKFIFLRTVIGIRIIMNTIVMIIFLNLGYGVVTLVIITSIFNFLVVFVNFIYCISILKVKIRFKNFDLKLLKEIIQFSFLLFTVVIFEKLIWSSSQIILGMYVSTAVLAIFSIAFLLQQIFVSFSSAFSSVFLPKITNMIVQKESNYIVSNLFIRSGRMQFIIISIVFSGFLLFGKYFILFWAGSEYSEAFIIAIMFFIPLTLLSVQSLGIVILQSRNELKFISVLYFFVFIISIIMQVYLSKYYGMKGSAFAVIIPVFFGPILILNIYYQKRQALNIIEFWHEIIKMAKYPFFFVIIIKILITYINITNAFWLLGCILIYSILYSFILWKFSLNEYEKNIFKEPMKFLWSSLIKR